MAVSKYQKRVARMVINPFTEGKITDAYPQLVDLTMNRGIAVSDMDKQFRYLAFVFDFNSPMVIEFTDLKERRKQAAIETGYRGAVNPALEIKFITTIVRNRLWLLICSSEATYYEFAELLSTKITQEKDDDILKSADKKIKLLKAMNEIEADLPQLYHKLYSGDESLEKFVNTTFDLKPETIYKITNGAGNK